MNRVLRLVLGITLILIGIVSLILPVLPGAVIIFIGAEVLGFKFLLWERVKERFFPAHFKKTRPEDTDEPGEPTSAA